MSEEYQRTERKAPSMRAASANYETNGRSANKARSYRAETYDPDDPNKLEPQTIILNTTSTSKTKKKSSSVFDGIRQKYNELFNKTDTGSGIKRKQAQRSFMNDILKKAFLALIALVIIILIIVLIVNSSQVKDVSKLSIESTATTQTLNWSGARKGLSYEVYRAEGNSDSYKLIETLNDGENSMTFDNLTAGTLYKYKVVTVKSNGDKTEGTAAEGYTKPNAVTGPSAATTSENSLTVNWNLQGNTSGYEIKYGIYETLSDADIISFSSDQVNYNSNSGAYSYMINDLLEDVTYYMSMRTVAGNNASEWCSVFSGTVTKSADITGIDTTQPMIALTFDGGPDGGTVTTRILDVLAQYNSKATFFQTGVNAEAYPELMQRIVNEGHEVGNHTYDESHVGGEVTADDIISANTAIEDACGVSPKLFRAPQGIVTDAIVDCCTTAGMSIVIWNFDSHDWEIYDPDEIIARIEAYAENGDIIQFRNIYDETATAIETIVPYLVDQGFQLVTVSQLIQANTGALPVPGKIYNSAYDSYVYGDE